MGIVPLVPELLVIGSTGLGVVDDEEGLVVMVVVGIEPLMEGS